jgi:hypothetical protein
VLFYAGEGEIPLSFARVYVTTYSCAFVICLLAELAELLFYAGEGEIPLSFARVYVTTYLCGPEPCPWILEISIGYVPHFDVRFCA